MAVSEVPVVTAADVTGVVDATAAAEIVVLIAAFLALLPDSANGTPGATPDYDAIRPELETNLRAEMAAISAAIAAAPTA